MSANRTEFAILGLLADGPRSGYDIRKEVQETLSHFWNESVSHIYPMLRRLHGKGLVSRKTELSEGRPPRHVYFITEEGLAELRGWLAEPIEPPPRGSRSCSNSFSARTLNCRCSSSTSPSTGSRVSARWCYSSALPRTWTSTPMILGRPCCN